MVFRTIPVAAGLQHQARLTRTPGDLAGDTTILSKRHAADRLDPIGLPVAARYHHYVITRTQPWQAVKDAVTLGIGVSGENRITWLTRLLSIAPPADVGEIVW